MLAFFDIYTNCKAVRKTFNDVTFNQKGGV